MKTNLYPSTELAVAREVEIHYKRPLFSSMAHIDSPQKAYAHLKSIISGLQIDYKEFFWVLLLSNANRLSAYAQIAIGSDKGVVLHTKEVFQLVLKANASAFILAHNHPSGKLTISDSDKRITKQIKKAADAMNIEFLDHIILSSESFVSMQSEGLI